MSKGISRVEGSRKGEGKLVNVSSISRQLANGGGGANCCNAASVVLVNNQDYDRKRRVDKGLGAAKEVYSPFFLYALCRSRFLSFIISYC